MELVFAAGGKLAVDAEAEFEPAADEIARGGATRARFLMAGAGTQIARPAAAAVGLGMNVALGEEAMAARVVEPGTVAHVEFRLADGAMAGVPAAVGGDGKIAAAGAARVGRAGAARDLFERDSEIGQPDRQPGATSIDLALGDAFQGGEISRPVVVAQRFAGLVHPQRGKSDF